MTTASERGRIDRVREAGERSLAEVEEHARITVAEQVRGAGGTGSIGVRGPRTDHVEVHRGDQVPPDLGPVGLSVGWVRWIGVACALGIGMTGRSPIVAVSVAVRVGSRGLGGLGGGIGRSASCSAGTLGRGRRFVVPVGPVGVNTSSAGRPSVVATILPDRVIQVVQDHCAGRQCMSDRSLTRGRHAGDHDLPGPRRAASGWIRSLRLRPGPQRFPRRPRSG